MQPAPPLDAARRPDVLWFNPFSEGHLAAGRAFTPTKHQRLLAQDLANLPQFLGAAGDIVMVPRRPAADFLSGLERLGFALPEFVELDVAGRSLAALEGRKLGRLRPWAWGPDSLELLAPLFAQVVGETRTAEQRFNPTLAQLYSKAWSASFLRRVLAECQRGGASSDIEQPPLLCEQREVGVVAESLDQALAAIALIRGRGHQKVVAKLNYGLAGQSALRLWEAKLLEPQRRWLASAIARRQRLVIEPWLERELDFSVQLEMTATGLRLCGFTGLQTDRRGQFEANWAEADHRERLPEGVVQCFAGATDLGCRLQRLYRELIARLETALQSVSFLGPVGIDAFVYRGSDGQCRLKPVVEINPRYTMGRLTVELMKRATPGSIGRFRLVSLAAVKAAGWANFPAYAHALTRAHPVTLDAAPTPLIREGALCLNDPAAAQVCLAVFEVSPEPFSTY